MHRSIQHLLDQNIVWVRPLHGDYWFGFSDGEKCRLIMGDFPDEPMYKLIWRGECLKFDDTPSLWIFPSSH